MEEVNGSNPFRSTKRFKSNSLPFVENLLCGVQTQSKHVSPQNPAVLFAVVAFMSPKSPAKAPKRLTVLIAPRGAVPYLNPRNQRHRLSSPLRLRLRHRTPIRRSPNANPKPIRIQSGIKHSALL